MKRQVLLFALGCIGNGMAQAADREETLQACRQMTGAEMVQGKPECLALLQQEAAARQAPPQAAAEAPLPPEKIARVLDAEWPQPMQAKRLSSYRQNYLLITHSSQPNDAPASPNPLNTVPPTYQLSPSELKFQFSVKTRISELAGGMLWFGYTQQSYWQFFDSEHSRPFRESNYEPELIYSYQLNKKSGFGLLPRILNVALEHQSNGQARPRSRSWNRFYVQGGWEDDDFFGNTLVVMPRVWKRIFRGDPADDDNPDITHYLGHGDVELRYLVRRADKKDTVFGASVRRRAVQFDISVPMAGSSDISFHLQHFRGYGESLIDYNQKHFTTGIGFSAYF